MTLTTQMYKVYIRTTPEKLWQAITDPDWTVKYGYGGHAHYDLQPGGALKVAPDEAFKAGHEAMAGTPCPDPIIDGEVLEADPPRRLVTTWRMLMDPEMAEEQTRITYEITDLGDGVCTLTLSHELPEGGKVAYLVSGGAEAQGGGGGHAWILSDLKSVLETGARMAS